MINIDTETVVTFREASKKLPIRREGKKPHVATFYRWSKCGLRGVCLETIQVGGTLCTSLEALQRFFDRLSHGGSPAASHTRSAASRPLTSRRLPHAWFKPEEDQP